MITAIKYSINYHTKYTVIKCREELNLVVLNDMEVLCEWSAFRLLLIVTRCINTSCKTPKHIRGGGNALKYRAGQVAFETKEHTQVSIFIYEIY